MPAGTRVGFCFSPQHIWSTVACRNYHEAKASYERALELLKIGKVTESKKQEIQTDLLKSISEVSVECENMPIALLSKDRYKVKNPHKQVSIVQYTSKSTLS